MRQLPPDLALDPHRDLLTEEVRNQMKNSDDLVMMDSQMEQSGIFGRPRPEFHAGFKTLLMALVECNDEIKRKGLYIDANLSADERQKFSEVGVFRQQIGKNLEVVLNWTNDMRGDIPPRHILVMWGGEFCGILGPYVSIRHCWSCGLRGWRNEEKTVAWVQPFLPCPRCRRLDWVARVISMQDVVRAAADWMANTTQNELFDDRFGRLGVDELTIQQNQAQRGVAS